MLAVSLTPLTLVDSLVALGHDAKGVEKGGGEDGGGKKATAAAGRWGAGAAAPF